MKEPRGSRRNAPCPCGSGEKAKRCARCMITRAHEEALRFDSLRDDLLVYKVTRSSGAPLAIRLASIFGVDRE